MTRKFALLKEIAKIDREGVDPQTVDSSTAYVGLEDVSSDGAVFPSTTSVVADLASTKFRFSEHHILFGKLRPYLRKVARPDFSGVCSTDIIPIAPSELVDRNYLFHFLRTDNVIALATSMSSGASLPRLSPTLLGEFEVPLPPLAEQQRIAAVLDHADNLRWKRELALARTNKLVGALYSVTFGSPCTTGFYDARPLSEVCVLENGDRSSNYPSGDDILNSGIPFLSGKNFRSDELDWSNTVFISEEKFSSLSRGKARRGDLIITLRGSLANCCIFEGVYEQAFINAQMMIIRPGSALLPAFVHATLVHPDLRGRLLGMATGAAVPQLTAKQIGAISIPVPPISVQKEFLKKVSAIHGMRKGMAESKRRLDHLFEVIERSSFKQKTACTGRLYRKMETN